MYVYIIIIDIRMTTVLKKVKHQLVEKVSSETADALGLSRAILCNGKRTF